MFRENGARFRKDDFNQITFDLEEMFHPVMLAALKNESLFHVKTVWSVFYGKCFTVKSKVKRIQLIYFFIWESGDSGDMYILWNKS